MSTLSNSDSPEMPGGVLVVVGSSGQMSLFLTIRGDSNSISLPYIPLAVSFAMRSGERRRQGHLDYALSRSFWAEQHPPTPTEEDGETLRRLALERLQHDLGVIEAGGDPEALRTNRTPKFLRP